MHGLRFFAFDVDHQAAAISVDHGRCFEIHVNLQFVGTLKNVAHLDTPGRHHTIANERWPDNGIAHQHYTHAILRVDLH